MLPLSIATYVKIGVGALIVLAVWLSGFGLGYSRLVAYKEKQATITQEKQDQHQAEVDKLRKDKNAQIDAINAKLFATLNELRSRPSRTEAASNGQGFTGRTGLSLFAEDSAFLVGEAARADKLRIELKACYAQYDAIGK